MSTGEGGHVNEWEEAKLAFQRAARATVRLAREVEARDHRRSLIDRGEYVRTSEAPKPGLAQFLTRLPEPYRPGAKR